jgi:predicted RNA binding protein with dsRBD fold (UPF0201 family)
MPNVRISCPVFPSEDPERVKKAVLNIFPDVVIGEDNGRLSAETDTLKHFSEQIRKQKILDTTRSVMMKGRRGDGATVFNMNKQTAYAGKISFVEERTILGTIKVTVEDENITAFIERLAPQTVEGEEVLI